MHVQACSQPCTEGGSVSSRGSCRLRSSQETVQSLLSASVHNTTQHWPFLYFQPSIKSSHSNFMLCTVLALLFASVHNTTLTILFIPAVTCSYMYSSYVILVSSFKGFHQTPRTPLAMIREMRGDTTTIAPPPTTDLPDIRYSKQMEESGSILTGLMW